MPKLFIGGLHPFVLKKDLIKMLSPFVELISQGKVEELANYQPAVTQSNQSVTYRGKNHIYNIEMKFDKYK